MKKLFTYLLSAMVIFAVGCEGFDDSLLWEEINSLKDRVTALEQLCRQMNTNISSLQTIVDALQNKDYVTNISPITEDDKVIGYSITFSKSGAITIYHGKDGKDGQNGQDGTDGKDGKDGYTPVIGIAKDTDGLYYWTLDGDWLLDNDGNKVKAVGVDGKDGADGKDGVDGKDGADGADGKDGVDGKDGEDGKDGVDGEDGKDGTDGKDGVTPKLKIEKDYWYISYDNGTTWTELGKATGEDGADGEDGDSMFKEVTYDREYVYITLIDGTQLVIPINSINIPNNQIWYTNGSITEATTPFYTYVFGAKIISNKYDAEKEHWVITFNGNVTSIGHDAFFYCGNLTSVVIPDSVTEIGADAFYFCSSLTSINIPDGVTSIGDRAFFNCGNLTSINIPDGITEIGKEVFGQCSILTSITIPDGVTSIGNGAFYHCGNLTSINIPDGITEIGKDVFNGCSSLTSITIPNSVTSIGEGAFRSCSSLTSITIPNSVTSIGDYTFKNCI